MYLFNKHMQNGWKHEYKDFECDADALKYGRSKVDEKCNMVAVYRHRDHDTSGAKDIIEYLCSCAEH